VLCCSLKSICVAEQGRKMVLALSLVPREGS